MKKALLLVLASVPFVLQTAHADPKSMMINRAALSGISPRNEVVTGFSYGLAPKIEATGSFDQVIDHFSKSKKLKAATFKQRYFIDSTLAKGDSAPVIYYFCGEGTCDGATSSSLVNTIAKKYGAHRVALEHRYYGYSQPFKTLESKNMKYLSMDQAIEDLAAFQIYATNSLGLKGKWIAVGGSYSGELSAFYRLKHPELVVGSLASSAPVLAKANFEEYDHHVAKVAGPQCLAAIQAAVADVESKLKTPESTAKVKALFEASDVKDNVDFLYVLADQAAIAIQYGYQDKFCNALIDGVAKGDVTTAYAKVGSELFAAFGLTALQDSFQGAESTDPNYYLGWAGMRSWMYQSCTEFGFYQAAYPVAAESSRSSQITLQYHNDVCNRLFGLTTQVNTERTNDKYYRQLFSPSTTNIFFTNGSNDPWSNLSILSGSVDASSNPALKFFTISGAAHCDDLGSRFSTALSQARDQFDVLVKQWLSE
jgi:pimeloyl-ACP methyl ester carboxylesterase